MFLVKTTDYSVINPYPITGLFDKTSEITEKWWFYRKLSFCGDPNARSHTGTGTQTRINTESAKNPDKHGNTAKTRINTEMSELSKLPLLQEV